MSIAYGVATDEIPQLKIGTSVIATTIVAKGQLSIPMVPASVPSGTCAEQNFNVRGLLVGDFVSVSPPLINPNVAPACARVSATDTLTVAFCNVSAGPLVPQAGFYELLVMR